MLALGFVPSQSVHGSYECVWHIAQADHNRPTVKCSYCTYANVACVVPAFKRKLRDQQPRITSCGQCVARKTKCSSSSAAPTIAGMSMDAAADPTPVGGIPLSIVTESDHQVSYPDVIYVRPLRFVHSPRISSDPSERRSASPKLFKMSPTPHSQSAQDDHRDSSSDSQFGDWLHPPPDLPPADSIDSDVTTDAQQQVAPQNGEGTRSASQAKSPIARVPDDGDAIGARFVPDVHASMASRAFGGDDSESSLTVGLRLMNKLC